jgi:hypothetical protein
METNPKDQEESGKAMEPNEKAKLLADLESGRKVLLEAVSGVTEEFAPRAPAPGRWSVLECVEHVAVSEDYLFGQIAASYVSEVAMINQQRESLIMAVGLDRAQKIQSPDVGKPARRFSTLAQAVDHFQATRKRTLEFVENCTEDMRCKITSHPIIGTVNCYETLLMIAAHPHRHAKQIEEIKKQLGHGDQVKTWKEDLTSWG